MRMWMLRTGIGALLAVLSAGAAAAMACSAQSPAHTLALLELYTSEGCSSCPPADRWLSGIGSRAAGRFVPLALHVDYWDRLGWPDRYASPRYTERQHALARLTRRTFVYTPGVFLSLGELRTWQSAAQFDASVREINARPAAADIRLELDTGAPERWPVRASFRLKPGVAAKLPQAYLAVYENGLATQVKAGENRGATLRHDYVVREWIGPIPLEKGAADYDQPLRIAGAWNTKSLGVAAFVQDFASGALLQAVALPACSPR